MEMHDTANCCLLRKMKFYLLIALWWGTSFDAFSQSNKFILEGSTTQFRCDCYRITPETKNSAGAAWNAERLDLSKPFDLSFQLFFGCDNDLGGDGSAFVLQPTAKLGTTGEGLGFGNLNPSIGIGFDTWENNNLNDPSFDHISIQKNGIIKHGNDLAGPISISASNNNVEDCNWHKFRVTWDPVTKWLRTYFDGIERVSTQTDLIKDVFGGNPLVYWGFTGATGDAVNRQDFCTLTEASFNVNLTRDTTCAGDTLFFKDNSKTFFPIQEYYWDWGDGTASRGQNPEPKIYTAPGKYNIRMSMTDVTGCVSNEYVKDIVVGQRPNASFDIEDACIPNQPSMSVQTNGYSNKIWYLNGRQFSTDSIPDFRSLHPGNYTVKQAIVSTVGCGADEAERIVSLQYAVANAGRDSAVIANMPFQLNGYGNGSILWTPSTGLSNETIATPTSTISTPQQYVMEVTTSAGCTAKDSVQILVFKDASIYVPNAFTPNNDGRNDIFIPFYVGIKKLHYFSVFNRWGGLVFTTNDFGKGWNGNEKNKQPGVGTYVWILSAEDMNGRKIQMKGSVTKVL
ncbi:gliding motility-associated C-terminal domain-containing protein [Flavisolibacter sp. BT320]|nr:gliding motility-associated C-terminal domain-containing protein [Flavisolibacter longurius]